MRLRRGFQKSNLPTCLFFSPALLEPTPFAPLGPIKIYSNERAGGAALRIGQVYHVPEGEHPRVVRVVRALDEMDRRFLFVFQSELLRACDVT